MTQATMTQTRTAMAQATMTQTSTAMTQTTMTHVQVAMVDASHSYRMTAADTEQQYSFAFVTFHGEHQTDRLTQQVQQIKNGGGTSMHQCTLEIETIKT